MVGMPLRRAVRRGYKFSIMDAYKNVNPVERPEHARLERMERVSSLYLRGYTQVEIASIIGVTHPTVISDLKDLRQYWLESQRWNFNEAMARELERIDVLEREAWAAFRRSCLDVQKTVIEKGIGEKGQPTKKRRKETVGQYGDPRFLNVIKDCIDKRCKLLGLDAPIKVEGQHEAIVEVIVTNREEAVSVADFIRSSSQN